MRRLAWYDPGALETYVLEQLGRVVRRRYSTKSAQWLTKLYWSAAGKNVFAVLAKTGKKVYGVRRVSAMGIRRYVKIKEDANLPARLRWVFLATPAQEG